MDLNFLVSILTLLFAALGVLLRRDPQTVKTIGLLVSGSSCAALIAASFQEYGSVRGVLNVLIGASAFLCILSQQPRRQASKPILLVLTISAFSFAYLSAELNQPIPTMALGGLLSTIVALAIKSRRENSISNWTAVAFGFAFLCLIGSSLAAGIIKLVLLLIMAAVLLPLFPLHAGFVGSLSSLPGTFRAFLAVVLPCLGWYTILANLSVIPHPLAQTVMVLALIGAIVSTTRAIVQIDLDQTFASIGTILFSLAWLSIATTGEANHETGWYVMSVALVTSGLLLCTHHLRARYGDSVRDNLPGLAQPMPRLSFVLCTLIMAAAGFPPFAVFYMFMAMILTSSHLYVTFWAAAIFLVSSLLLVSVMQQLLFGNRRTDLIYEDLENGDLIALVLVVSLLLAGSLLPYMVNMTNERATIHQKPNLVPPMVTSESLRHHILLKNQSPGLLRQTESCLYARGN
ncbi:MAG: proton-conducting transporter membrane subunit [Candidatus Melainabacteria bacterium]|nr:proton-conducting transporter membrane subunit [Candidatus Melainabacteria bacterium]